MFGWAKYTESLELQLAQQRNDFTERLREKEAEIRRLRAELSVRNVRIEPNPVVPANVKYSDNLYPLKFEGAMDWQGELSELLKEEEIPNGI